MKTRRRPSAASAATGAGSDGRLDRRGGELAQGANYYERDGYYTRDSTEHRMLSAWAGKGALRIPKLVLVGDARQLEAVDAGKPFAQLQAAGMKTATMGEILRQRDPDLKAAVEASIAGDIGRAFEKLGDNVAQVNPENIAGAVAARWLKLPPEMRERTGVMSPGHELREAINAHIRERLVREGRVAGPALKTQRLVSRGYTNAEKALAANYAPGDVVAFHRSYKRIGAQKGEERRVLGVDREGGTVRLEGPQGSIVDWKPA